MGPEQLATDSVDCVNGAGDVRDQNQIPIHRLDVRDDLCVPINRLEKPILEGLCLDAR